MARATKKVIDGKVVSERKGLPRTNLPVKLPQNITWLKQPNVITFMAGDFKTLQLRVIILIIEKLQEFIQKSIDYIDEFKVLLPCEQLSLFRDNSNIVPIEIAYKDLGVSHVEYETVRTVLKQLTSIPVELKTIDPETGDKYCSFQSLVAKVILNETKKYSRNFIVELDKDIAKAFIDVDKGFTKFIKEIAFASQSKYTIKMYLLISSWKSKGGFEMTLTEFRKLFLLQKKYLKYKDLYKRVIRPAYEELFEKADCWFEVEEKYLTANDTEPYKLSFKIIKSALSKTEQDKLDKVKESISNLCYSHLRMEDKHMSKLMPYITLENARLLYNKIIYLGEYILKNGERIKDISEYALSALLKEVERKE